jgi:hypothetical protein
MNDIDQYSNMLFVMKEGEKLFKLAHEYMKIEEDRPEVQVLIGEWTLQVGRMLLLNQNARELLQHDGWPW